MRRFMLLLAAALVLPHAAFADWKVSPDGAALIENDGSSALSLRCDTNSNTGNVPKWLVRVDALGLGDAGPQLDMVFRFPGHAPLTLRSENRNGFASIEGMNAPTQSDIQALIRRLKGSSRVTIALIDSSSGTAFMDPLTFPLRGSGRAIRSVAAGCRE